MKKSELRQIIGEEIQKILNESNKFTVTVVHSTGGYGIPDSTKILSKTSFDDKKQADLFVRKQIKKYKLKRQYGFWGNSKTGIELTTNY